MAGCGARIALELSMDLDPSDQPVEVAEGTYLDKQRKLLFCCISNLDTRSSLLVGLPRILEDQVKPQHLDALVGPCRVCGPSIANHRPIGPYLSSSRYARNGPHRRRDSGVSQGSSRCRRDIVRQTGLSRFPP